MSNQYKNKFLSLVQSRQKMFATCLKKSRTLSNYLKIWITDLETKLGLTLKVEKPNRINIVRNVTWKWQNKCIIVKTVRYALLRMIIIAFFTVNVWNLDFINPNLTVIQTFVSWFQTIHNQKCLKTEVFGNPIVIECL